MRLDLSEKELAVLKYQFNYDTFSDMFGVSEADKFDAAESCKLSGVRELIEVVNSVRAKLKLEKWI